MSMVGRTIGRFGLLLLAGCLFAASAVTAQTSQSPGADDLRRKVTEGTEFCRKTLASAPPDIKIGEVEEFCACMGVQEAAMGEMAEAGKASLRPQLQQMCVGTLRSRQGLGTASPAPAVMPAAPGSSGATPGSAEPPRTAPPAAAAITRFEAWSLTTNRAGASIAYIRTAPFQDVPSAKAPQPAPAVDAFIMYCRAKDAIGLRALAKPGLRLDRVEFAIGGWGTIVKLGANGVANPKDWTQLVKDLAEADKHNPPPDQRQNFDPYIEFQLSRQQNGPPGGRVNVDGIGAARVRLRTLCADAAATGGPIGNFDTTGIEGFPEEAIVPAAPNRTPVGVPAIAPRASAVEAKPKAAPDCAAAFERNYAALRRKELDLAGQTGAVMQTQPRFFWDFCPITRQEIAVAKQILAAANACPSHRNAAAIKSQALAKLAKRQAELQRPRCM